MAIDGLFNLLGRYSPNLYRDQKENGILLMVQGEPPHYLTFDQLYAGNSPKFKIP